MSPMRFAALLLAPLLVIPLLTQCGNEPAPTSNAVTGPFDSRGNYIEDWADSPEKWYKPSTPAEKAKKKSVFAKKETPPKEIAVVEPKPTPSPTVTTPKPVAPKPQPKPTPKPQPKIVYHTVRKGDTLTKIGRTYGVTVSALRRSNGISGDLIRIGQRLKIQK
ncbi:MAG: LysM peptidoglycan-binding domain-containing protein [Luteolibacter sp.]